MLALLFALLGLPVVGGAIAYFRSRPEAVARRALKRAPLTPIATARDGAVVKVVGVVAYAGPPIESPLARRCCAYYSVVVENEKRSSGLHYEVLREERCIDFYVQDASGVALVRIRGAAPSSALLGHRRFFTTFDGNDLDRFMKARGQSTRGLFLYKRLHAREGVVEAGARVAVCGRARRETDAGALGAAYRDSAHSLVLEASGAVPLYLSNDPAVA